MVVVVVFYCVKCHKFVCNAMLLHETAGCANGGLTLLTLSMHVACKTLLCEGVREISSFTCILWWLAGRS